jgi:adenosylcobinamide-GDP ribazoletransferase
LSFLAAFQLLTSIPVSTKREVKPEQLGRATAWFPLVGLIIGVFLVVLDWLLSMFLPAVVVNALLIAALALVTGALHLDGFADTCDGLAGKKPVEERWRIMHDSRSGAFGVVGIVLLLLVQYVSLNNVPQQLITPTLLFMPVISRWAMVYAIFVFPSARPAGLGSAYKLGTRWPQFTIATITTLLIAALLFLTGFYINGFALIIGTCMVTTLLSLYFRRKFAGLTGDNYGAINEAATVTALLVVIGLR